MFKGKIMNRIIQFFQRIKVHLELYNVKVKTTIEYSIILQSLYVNNRFKVGMMTCSTYGNPYRCMVIHIKVW
jgi:hypothetical protein